MSTAPAFVSLRARDTGVRAATSYLIEGVLLSDEDVIAPASFLGQLPQSAVTGDAVPDFEVVVAPPRASGLPVERFLPAKVGLLYGDEQDRPAWVLVRLGSRSQYGPPGANRVIRLADELRAGADPEKAFRASGLTYPSRWDDGAAAAAVGDLVPGGPGAPEMADADTRTDIQARDALQIGDWICLFTDKCEEGNPPPEEDLPAPESDGTLAVTEIRLTLADGRTLFVVAPDAADSTKRPE